MIKILFVCHGNICRSPMAEYLFRDKIEKLGLASQFHIASAATSTEELGNPPHHGTQKILSDLGISCYGKRAVRIKKKDYDAYDFIIGMDDRNIQNMQRIFGGDPEHKIYKFLDFSENPRNIADPWYTGNFKRTYEDIQEAGETFLAYLEKEQSIQIKP